MRNKDIAFLESCMELLGYRRVEWAHFLGPSYRQWKPVHIERLKLLIEKRIDKCRALDFPDLDKAWTRALLQIENSADQEARLLCEIAKGKTRLGLEDFRKIARNNETTVASLEKTAHSLGWERTKDKGIVSWRPKKKPKKYEFKPWEGDL